MKLLSAVIKTRSRQSDPGCRSADRCEGNTATAHGHGRCHGRSPRSTIFAQNRSVCHLSRRRLGSRSRRGKGNGTVTHIDILGQLNIVAVLSGIRYYGNIAVCQARQILRIAAQI